MKNDTLSVLKLSLAMSIILPISLQMGLSVFI